MSEPPDSYQSLDSVVRQRLPDLDGDVVLAFMALSRLGRMIERDTMTVLRADALEASEHAVMTVLWLRGPESPLSPTQLSKLIIQTPSGMTKTLRRLERAGLVERVHDPASDRRWSVHLTPAGSALAEEHLRQRISQWNEHLERYATMNGRLADILWALIDASQAPGEDDRPRFEIWAAADRSRARTDTAEVRASRSG